ncbi:hypothetical protein AAHE18_08G171400 [Arachis hypogaea]
MRDLMRFKDDQNLQLPFGGKTIIFGGDFRQILPVKGTRQDIVNASSNFSYLWQHCEILWLIVNMQLQSMTTDSQEEDLKQFTEWILQVGNRKSEGTSDGYNMIKISLEFLITDYNDPIQGIAKAIHPDYIPNMANESQLKSRAILARRINVVDEVNDYMIALNNNECKTLLVPINVFSKEVSMQLMPSTCQSF